MKRTYIVSLFFLAVFFGGFLMYREFMNRGETVVPITQSRAAAFGAAALVLDSDGDGLKDWEEELWRTDPFSSDTDGDGTNDAAEIKVGRNPVVAGPNDILDPVAAVAKVNQEAKKATPDTERLARELFATYLSTRREGFALSENEVATMVDAVSASVPDIAPVKFFEKDISIFTDETPEQVRAYGNALGAIFRKPWPARENELAIFERALRDPNPETAALDLANLTPIALAYGNLSRDIARIAVPEGARAHHLRLANTAAEIGESIRGMAGAFTDPVKTFASVGRYLDAGERFGNVLTDMRSYFERRGVVFFESEVGYALWQITQ